MNVGLVNMNPSSKQEEFIETLQSLHCNVHLFDAKDYTKDQLLKIIQHSDIQKWIFTGSPANVYDVDAKMLPLGILDCEDKEMFLICYSVESVLYQLGYPVVKRNINKKEEYILDHRTKYMKNPAHVYRNHQYYTPSNAIDSVSEYEGEAMIYFYQNSCMTQFHPEKTKDGKQMLFVWLFQNDN